RHSPVANEGSPRRRPVLAGIETVMQPARRREERGPGHSLQCALGALHFAFLIEIGLDQPLMHAERVAGGGEDAAAINGPQAALHAQAQAFEQRSECRSPLAISVRPKRFQRLDPLSISLNGPLAGSACDVRSPWRFSVG